MAEIRVGENESLDNALKRFKRQCARAGVLSEYRKIEHYEKPIVKRKEKNMYYIQKMCSVMPMAKALYYA